MLAAARRAGCSRPLRLLTAEHGRQIASTARRRAAGNSQRSLEDTLQRLHDDGIDQGHDADGSASHRPEASVRHVMQKSAESLPDTYHENRAAMQATIGVMLARYRLGKAQHASNPVLEARHRILAYVRAVRKHSNVAFLSLADGSLDGAAELSAVLHKSNSNVPAALKQDLAPGVAVELVGKLKERNASQEVEFVIETAKITGRCDAATYPIPLTATASKATSTSADAAEQNLRRYAHLRPRDMRHVNILRMRSTIERAIDGYFAGEDFVRVAAPIITSSDCEGGGEVFRVTRDEAGKGKNGFWSGSRAYLTVSAQLHLEALTQGLGRVCTTGPAFRAEGSATNRHLAEFWMCEAEQMTYGNAGMALAQVTTTVENVVRAAMEAALSNKQAMSFLWRDDVGGLAAMRRYLRQGWSWPRHTYSGAIKALHEAAQSKHEETSTTETAPSMPPQWGEALSSEHERYLARNGPVFITHYPAHLKPFYMRRDGQGPAGQATAACFDLLMPGLGELAGGSLRENNGPNLFRQMAEAGVKSAGDASATSSSDSDAPGDAGKQTDLFAPLSEYHPLHWYGEIRKYGAAPTGGFGIGIERLIAWLTNTRSVRDVVTFPRVKGPLRY